jgi:ribose/xylose/arabinose/galactoside ABC-type transport system permease subunit
MNASAQTVSQVPTGHRRPIFALYGGLVAGTFDITYACVFWALKAGVAPERIFQSVAAGLLGRASFSGGFKTAALGLFLHYFIATTMSLVYYLVSGWWKPLYRQPWFYGPVYGLLLYGVMNHIVLPLSRALPGSKNPLWVGLSIAVHMLLIGVPIALFARKAHRP